MMWASPAVTARIATGPPPGSALAPHCCCFCCCRRERGTAAVRTVVAGWPAEACVSASSAAGCNMVYTYTHKHGILWFVFSHPAAGVLGFFFLLLLWVRMEPPVSHTSLLFFNVFFPSSLYCLWLPFIIFFCLFGVFFFFLPLARAVCSCYCRYPLLLWLMFVYIRRRVCGEEKKTHLEARRTVTTEDGLGE